MKFLVQRVNRAQVDVDGNTVGKINKGFFVLIGICETDTKAEADKLIKKLLGLRIFPDDAGKTNLSLMAAKGDLLLVSQFTLYADIKHGNRPSFIRSGSAEHAEELYDYIVDECRKAAAALAADSPDIHKIKVETGIFGAHMKCSIENDGPFTIDMDSDEL